MKWFTSSDISSCVLINYYRAQLMKKMPLAHANPSGVDLGVEHFKRLLSVLFLSRSFRANVLSNVVSRCLSYWIANLIKLVRLYVWLLASVSGWLVQAMDACWSEDEGCVSFGLDLSCRIKDFGDLLWIQNNFHDIMKNSYATG